jgi:hypothetical protein
MFRNGKQLWGGRGIGVLVLLPALLSACKDSTEPDNGTPPVLPPVASMQVDLSFFAQAGGAAEVASGAVGLNWAAAALRVGVANLAVSLVLAVPAATWAAAGSQTPTVEEGKWHWRFNAQQGGVTHAAHVTGYLDGSESVWEMRITNTALGLNEFLWYDGRAALDGAAGSWSFHDAATGSATEAGRIDWTHASNTSWRVDFTDTNSASPGAGDVLRYESSGTARNVSFVDVSTGETVEIGWDSVTKAGWLIAPAYNNGLKACWDASLNDAAC